jgi:hypothetical protein
VFDGHAGARAAEYAAEHLHVRFLAGLVAYMAMVDQGLVPGMSGQGGGTWPARDKSAASVFVVWILGVLFLDM